MLVFDEGVEDTHLFPVGNGRILHFYCVFFVVPPSLVVVFGYYGVPPFLLCFTQLLPEGDIVIYQSISVLQVLIGCYSLSDEVNVVKEEPGKGD